MKTIYLKIAGVLNLLTAFLHLIGGQLSLVNPLMDTSLGHQEKSEWLGVWHMVTIFLFTTAFVILKFGFNKNNSQNKELLNYIGILLILCGLPFVGSSIYYRVLAPQWILFFPMGILVLKSIKETKSNG